MTVEHFIASINLMGALTLPSKLPHILRFRLTNKNGIQIMIRIDKIHSLITYSNLTYRGKSQTKVCLDRIVKRLTYDTNRS